MAVTMLQHQKIPIFSILPFFETTRLYTGINTRKDIASLRKQTNKQTFLGKLGVNYEMWTDVFHSMKNDNQFLQIHWRKLFVRFLFLLWFSVLTLGLAPGINPSHISQLLCRKQHSPTAAAFRSLHNMLYMPLLDILLTTKARSTAAFLEVGLT